MIDGRRARNMRSSARTLFGLLLMTFLSMPGRAAAQQIPVGMSIEDLTPEQRALLLQRLQQSGALSAPAGTAGGGMQEPGTLVPPLQEQAGVAAVDTSQFYVERPYDFAGVGQELDSVTSLKVFGTDLFQLSSGTFDPPAFGPVGPDYTLGPGDEIVIQMWGDYQNLWTRSLTREGYILLPDVGQVVLSGLTLERALQRLYQVLTPHYEQLAFGRPGAQAFLDVSIGRLRGITVYVLGDVQRAGAYTLSSISTAFTALYAARGPKSTGSLRTIHVIRGNRIVATLDAYDLVLLGVRSRDVRLENGDMIFVPTVGTQVAVTGRVLRPAVYEMKPGERLADALSFAGGLSPSALRSRAQVARILPSGERTTPWVQVVVDVELETQLAEPSESLTLVSGDVVRILGVPTDRRDIVMVEGAVWNPGRLQLTGGLTVRGAIQRAGGLREEALPSLLAIVRTNPDESTTQVSVILAAAMEGDPEHDVVLQGRDRLVVYSIHDVYARDQVTIYGSVRTPGSYLLHEGMTLNDLLARAGGLSQEAWSEWVEVARIHMDPQAGRTGFQKIQIPIDTTYSPVAGIPFLLAPFDQVFVRRQPYWDTRRNVTISGEVLFPGQYALQDDEEKLTDLIQRAGGLTPYAYPEGTRFVRAGRGGTRVNVHLDRALRDPGSLDNLVLLPGDEITVPAREPVVRVTGSVEYPTSVLYVSGKGPGYYIGQAGGFADGADRGRTRVTLPNGSIWRPRWWIIPDPEVEPGSDIFVPQKPESAKDTWETIRDVTAILSSLTTVLLLVWRIGG